MEQKQGNSNISKSEKFSNWYDKHYKKLLLIPIILMALSLSYIIYFYSTTGDLVKRDISLSGGTSIILSVTQEIEGLEENLYEKFEEVSIRKLTDVRTGKTNAYIIESSTNSEELKSVLEEFLGYELTNENSSIEFSGSSLSESFYRQLLFALIISFILMSIVVFILFRTLIPSLAIIFSALADIIMPLAIINLLGIRISAAGIAAFLMLIGYSVDTDVLLTTRAIKRKNTTLNKRLYSSFKTGITMTLTSLFAVLPAFLFISGLPDSFRQIFLILSLGLSADLINTWITNTSIIKWYCEKKGIQ